MQSDSILTPDVQAALALLSTHPEFRVLRKLQHRDTFSQSTPAAAGTVVILDTETTGRSLDEDQVIELAMLRVEYDVATGEVLRVVDSYSGLEDPGRPIPAQATAINGITDEMVAGHALDESRIRDFLVGSPLVIAHNAHFDRTFLELRLPFFADLSWACSYQQVPWTEAGFGSGKLEFLCWSSGFYYDAHRGGEDCRALLELLSHPLPGHSQSTLALLVNQAQEKSYRLWAVGSAFETKDKLKARGYRWDGERRCWNISVSRDEAKAEADWLKTEIYGGRAREIEVETLDATSRFSNRSGAISKHTL